MSSTKKLILKQTGVIATLIGIMSSIPIIFRVWRTKNTDFFPTFALTLSIISNTLWVIFGLYTGVLASLLSGILYLLFNVFILAIKIIY